MQITLLSGQQLSLVLEVLVLLQSRKLFMGLYFELWHYNPVNQLGYEPKLISVSLAENTGLHWNTTLPWDYFWRIISTSRFPSLFTTKPWSGGLFGRVSPCTVSHKLLYCVSVLMSQIIAQLSRSYKREYVTIRWIRITPISGIVRCLNIWFHLHTRRGQHDKRQVALAAIGRPELNANNPPEILFEAARIRKARFLRAMARQYV